MGTRYLIDTNICIYLFNDSLPPTALAFIIEALDAGQCELSVISKMEVLGWNFPSEAQRIKAANFFNRLPMYWLNAEIVDKTIEIRKAQPKTKLPDAIIATTALENGLTLLTRNTTDFSKLPGIQLVNPFVF